jgi:hypothetical protein
VRYARDHLIPLVDEGLGNSAYLADCDEVDLGGLRPRAGHDGLAVLAGGAAGWAAATGRPLQEGA